MDNRSKERVRLFCEWPTAYEFTRRFQKPVVVSVPVGKVREVARIYPTGKFEHVRFEEV